MIKLAVIGAGARGWDLARQAMTLSRQVRVTAIVDPDAKAVRTRITADGGTPDGIAFYQDIDSFLGRANDCDGLIIASRCSTHADLAARVAGLGKPLFLEKPVAITMEQLAALRQAYQGRMDRVVVSFPLRLTPLFRAVLAVIATGRLGTINQVQAFNNVPYGGVYFGHWYRDYSETGGLWLQKATHDFDYINLLIRQRPVMVAAVGTRAVYGGSRPCDLKCSQCPDTATCPESPVAHLRRGDTGGMASKPGGDHDCAFSDCIKHDDASSALIVYENGVHASYTQNFVSRRSAARRGAVVTGYHATLIFDWYGGAPQVIDHFEKRVEPIVVPPVVSGHAGGDEALLANFINVIRKSEPSLSTLQDGMLSAAMCVAATESAAARVFQPVGQW